MQFFWLCCLLFDKFTYNQPNRLKPEEQQKIIHKHAHALHLALLLALCSMKNALRKRITGISYLT